MLEHVHAMAQSVQTNVGPPGCSGCRLGFWVIWALDLRVWCIQTNLGAVRALLLSLFERHEVILSLALVFWRPSSQLLRLVFPMNTRCLSPLALVCPALLLCACVCVCSSL